MATDQDCLQFGLKETTLKKIVAVLRHYPDIDQALLYGSRAKGNYRPGSDIDITLVGDDITYQQLTQLENELDDLLLPYLFDLSIFRHIDDLDVIEHIHRVGVIFYERSPEINP